ncbi:unnamed protein product [Aphanomyces euteiches]
MERDDEQVVQDVHFLFATDDKLREDLAYVCDLLDSNDEDQLKISAKPTTARLKATHCSQYQRQKREILELRRQAVTATPDMSLWERAARDQLYAKSKALCENEQLRAHVEENATFIEEMTRALQKRPRLSLNSHSEDWKAYKLAAQASLRTAAIHAIADRQYALLDTVFIKSGLFENSEEVIREELMNQTSGSVLFERVYHVPLAAPFRLIGAEESLEIIDPYTVYRAYRNVDKTAAAYANMIYKYYVEADREVCVWRSVLKDELMPHMTQGTVHDQWGW